MVTLHPRGNNGQQSIPPSGPQADMTLQYLSEIGRNPLLSHVEEIRVAKTLAHNRQRLRRRMLSNDFVLRHAVELLKQVSDGRLRLDRVINIPVTCVDEKAEIRKHIDRNLHTLVHLLQRNSAHCA